MNASEAFPSARAKIDRARQQTDALASELERFYAELTYSVRERFDAATGRKTAIFTVTKPLVPTWSAIIGEIVHDLRSALDTAVYDLTIAEQGGPLDGTEFPVYEDEAKYTKTSKKGVPDRGSGLFKIRGINDRAKTLVKELQPFEFRKTHSPNQASILALLHELSIIDKHRTIHLMRQKTSEFGWRVLRDIKPISMVLPFGALEDGVELGEWIPTILDDDPDVEFNAAFEIVFGETTTLNGQGITSVARALTTGVDRMILHYLAATLG
jgi:hypothetical protein